MMLPNIIAQSPIAPANSLIIPTTFWKVAPFSRKSCKYLINSLRSEASIRKPNKPPPTPSSAKPFSLSRNVINPCAIFHAANAVPMAVAVNKIFPRRVSKSSAHVSMSSVIPSHSFIFWTSSSIGPLASCSKKSYPGSSIPSPPPPIPSNALFPLSVSSGGEMMFSSSIPSKAFLTSFAFFAAFPRLSSKSDAPPAAPPTLSLMPPKSVISIPNILANISAINRTTFATAIRGGRIACNIGRNILPKARAHCSTCILRIRS